MVASPWEGTRRTADTICCGLLSNLGVGHWFYAWAFKFFLLRLNFSFADHMILKHTANPGLPVKSLGSGGILFLY